jgi:hypothetical protein
MDINLAYKISITILLFSTILSSLELIRTPKLFLHFLYPTTSKKNKHEWWLLIQSLKVVLVILTVISFYKLPAPFFYVTFITLTLLEFYSQRLRKIGKDGSDQLRLLSLLGVSFCFILDAHLSKLVPLIFIGMQVLLGYTTSGLVKVFSTHWRKGDVLSGILSTNGYGFPRFATMLKKSPTLEKSLTYSAMAIMLSVPICFLLPYPEPILISLFLVFSFHFGTAILMGLNDFLFTFPVAFPGIIVLHSIIFNY